MWNEPSDLRDAWGTITTTATITKAGTPALMDVVVVIVVGRDRLALNVSGSTRVDGGVLVDRIA